MDKYVLIKSIELDTDYLYDVFQGEAQAELDDFVGQLIDVTDFMDEDNDVWEAARDWLTHKTGLLIADLEIMN